MHGNELNGPLPGTFTNLADLTFLCVFGSINGKCLYLVHSFDIYLIFSRDLSDNLLSGPIPIGITTFVNLSYLYCIFLSWMPQSLISIPAIWGEICFRAQFLRKSRRLRNYQRCNRFSWPITLFSLFWHHICSWLGRNAFEGPIPSTIGVLPFVTVMCDS